jgi:hypothetical protein
MHNMSDVASPTLVRGVIVEQVTGGDEGDKLKNENGELLGLEQGAEPGEEACACVLWDVVICFLLFVVAAAAVAGAGAAGAQDAA